MMFLQVQSLLLLHPQPLCHMQLPFQVTQHEVLMGCRKKLSRFSKALNTGSACLCTGTTGPACVWQ